MDIEKANKKCIAIGDGATCTKNLEIVIKINGLEGKAIITESEFRIMSSVLRRLKFKKDN
jgi:hypothetical protein